MALINYGYFLFGLVIFFTWRLFHLHPYFKREDYPTPGWDSVWFLIWGSVILLVLINTFQNIDLTYGLDYLALLPTILFVLALINFWGESFIAPTKNYLIAILIGFLIGIVTLILTQQLVLFLKLHHILSYLELLSIVFGILAACLGGKIVYNILTSRYSEWNTPLWELNRFWDIINHTNFYLVILTVALIEGLIQLQSTSLIILLTSF